MKPQKPDIPVPEAGDTMRVCSMSSGKACYLIHDGRGWNPMKWYQVWWMKIKSWFRL